MADLLVEIGTEELPPKDLKNLSESLEFYFYQKMIKLRLVASNRSQAVRTIYATPRRIAFKLAIQDKQSPQASKGAAKMGPKLEIAYDEQKKPTKAGLGFARSCGVDFDKLIEMDGKLAYIPPQPPRLEAQELYTEIADILAETLKELPISKRMRWGNHSTEFVRPVHWVVLVLDDEVIPATILGIESGNATRGHRFHHADFLTVAPDSYEHLLKETGHVVADFEQRREMIRQQVTDTATKLGGEAVIDVDLLDEVTALVEWPMALAGSFEEKFLEVPHEALITTMEDNQKYFAVVNSDGKLMPHFITVSNIESSDPSKVIEGNERVIRPRFADAVFFWEQDKKQKLEARTEALKSIVFQKQLGTLWDKTERVAALAKIIAKKISADEKQAERAAHLSKCDLMTDMVGEFPKMQGIAGRYYALHDGEPEAVAWALEEQYLPKYAGDLLPENPVSQSLALADKLDTLAGIFGIGQKPTGAKDPFALRRAALGILRILIEQKLDLDLKNLMQQAADNLGSRLTNDAVVDDAFDYVMDRLKAYYQDQRVAVGVIDAVLAQRPTRPLDFDRRIQAVKAFHDLPEAESLAAANKRIRNILKKVDGQINDSVDEKLLQEKAEQTLYSEVAKMQASVTPLFDAGDYEPALKQLAGLRESVDQFFDDVMVMTDDEALKNNRLALLDKMRNLFLRVADLSRLQ
ncbi:MAG TPA: glycine--tRNA ligase subunit beta [Chromatiales bacterium]|nr:glycine--tRNA ligase subunit beta [Thiotrichales bacterium]HIP67482.1 glycine--tRNA ligase subunit beta [Chromatiales bacterium]